MDILVLNADFQPLNVTTLHRGFNLVYTGKAEVIEFEAERPIVSTVGKFKRPLIIRLVRYVYLPFKKVPLSRFNIYRRDGHQCVYCPSKNKATFTLDHVYPKSRGGKNSWDNLVTSCKKCNAKKDNRTPKEAGMTMRVKPYTPTFQEFAIGLGTIKQDKWTTYFNR